MLIGKPLILCLFGREFLPTFTVVWILILGIIPLSISRICISYLAGKGKIEYLTYQSIVSMVVTLILDFLLIPKFGIIGGAIASSVSYFTGTIIVFVGFLNEIKTSAEK
jgi:O-antigen/teichoic acid export membrane protein